MSAACTPLTDVELNDVPTPVAPADTQPLLDDVWASPEWWSDSVELPGEPAPADGGELDPDLDEEDGDTVDNFGWVDMTGDPNELAAYSADDSSVLHAKRSGSR